MNPISRSPPHPLPPSLPPQTSIKLEFGPYIRSLAWDPEGTYLAASTADGNFSVFEKAKRSASAAPSLRRVIQRRSAAVTPRRSLHRCDVAWHPDGSMLAVRGTQHSCTARTACTARLPAPERGGR